MRRQFPNLIDAYLEYTSGHESTERVRKWCIISVIAAALERRVWLNRGFYTLFPNLYVFIIGRSGFVKKSTSTSIAVNLLRELQGVKIMSERLTAGSLINQLQMSGKKFEFRGKPVLQSALFAYASELSVFLSEVFGSITELLTTFYDCQPNDSSKPWVYNTVGRGETKIHGPCLNILGASTKAWLRKCIPKSEMEGGFTSRIVFVVENRLPEKLVAWPTVDMQGEMDRLKLIEDLRAVYSMVGEYKVTDEARELFAKWYENHMRNVLPMNQDPRMVGYMSRKGDTILKLAMVRAAARSSDLVLAKEDVIWAAQEIDVLEGDWRLAFDGLGIKNNLPWELREYIRKKIRVPKTEILQVFGQQYPASELGKAVSELEEMEEIVSAQYDGVACYSFPGADFNWSENGAQDQKHEAREPQ